MNLKQIQTIAVSEYACLSDPDCIKVYVGSTAGNGAVGGITALIKEEITRLGKKAAVIETGSFGYYDLEPTVLIEKSSESAVLYSKVSRDNISRITNDFLIQGSPKPGLAYCSFGDNKFDGIPDSRDLPLFNLQRRVALRNCGHVDPGNILHYILCAHGYSGLAKCLEMSRPEVIAEIKKSGLRGRGGAGYPTGDKWQICFEADGNEKYVVCNAIDGDPQALTARLLLESDPHSVLEGVLIGAYAVGASHCYICLTGENQFAIERLNVALEQMRKYGLLGNNILGSSFSAEIEIKTMKRSLVAGEETALLRAMEGKQAIPYIRTSYPAMSGFQGKPTLVNNVETFANVSAILQNLTRSNSGSGSGEGTRIISLTGKTVHKYTVEVPFTASLHNIVMDIGGGVRDHKKFKALQIGGPTGAFLGEDSLDMHMDYESINASGSIMGSGTVELFDSDSCAVETVRDIMAYLQDQSCGKCVFCREGTYQMFEILKDIAENGGRPGDLELLIELGDKMKTGSICGFGRTVPNPLLSSLKLFHQDYDFHIKEKRCPVSEKIQ